MRRSGVEIVSVKPRLIEGKVSRIFHSRLLGQDKITPAVTATVVKSVLIRDYARQRHLFQITLSKIEGLATLPCLRRPGFRLLAELARETRSYARRTDLELARGADANDPYTPQLEYIDQLIERTSDLQDRLQRQLALVAQWQEDAGELQAELELLLARSQSAQGVPFDGLRGLARRLISELLFDVTPPVLHPQLALDMLTERLENRTHARIFAVALASAQLVARVARVTWLREDQVELVTAAALLQDCGKLAMQQRTEQEQLDQKLSTTVRRHARIGAAIATSYRNAPVGLTDLIARHHQRLHQSPAPSTGGNRLAHDFAHLLAAASRFERLRLELADQSTLLTDSELVDQPAMIQFWNETRTGIWSQTFVRKILAQRDGYEECLRTTNVCSAPHFQIRKSSPADTK
ncbi:MAG: HDIG domain-containing metalloprotein [Planctomycetota bacterium]